MHNPLLEKYNIPAPRYTSYPTVPYWQPKAPSSFEWEAHVRSNFEQNPAISLYIHLPYCESLCTYCGCNKRITKNHSVEGPYIDALLEEWKMYAAVFPQKSVIKEIHLGGGTPTFFAPKQLKKLISGILSTSQIDETFEFGFEAHPGSTTLEHLTTLYELGFRRLSIGVQDFATEILNIINRKQSLEEVTQVTKWAREIGYTSINYDLIFGLPLQTESHIRRTVDQLRTLMPERIAFYSYAHVPWIKPSQRAYSEADLPRGAQKRALYELGRELLETSGYQEIGLDHFALPSDPLYISKQSCSLHRNFMGYTNCYTRLSIALGASAISDTWDAYIQNEKHIENYMSRVFMGEFPILKGHLLSETDQILRTHILNIMCREETSWSNTALQCDALFEGLERLDPLDQDGLIKRYPFHLEVTAAGRPFLRNICLALDEHYWIRQPEGQLFSSTI